MSVPRQTARRSPPRSVALLAVAVALALVTVSCGGQEVSAPELNTTLASEISVVEPPVTTTVDLAVPDTDPSTLYVSSEFGSDDNDGQTMESPWASLQTALDRLEPGNTLFVLDGRYDEQREPGVAHYVVNVSGTPDAWIRVTAGPDQSPELVASAGNGISVRGDYVEISGLRVRGEGFDVENNYGWGLLIRNSHHVRLANNTISSMAVGGISSVESSNLEILDNEVFDNSFWGTEQGSGISLWHSVDSGLGPAPDGYHDRIIGNVVYRNENKVFSRWRDEDVITDGNGIIIDQNVETGYTGRALVANNVVFDNGGRGILVLESNRVDVMFNTTYNNGRTDGLEGGPVELVASRADDVRLLNNLAWSRSGAPAVTVADASNVELGGNVLITDSPSGFNTELDLVSNTDPGLAGPSIDPSIADFRPRPGSIVIDRAIAVNPRVPYDADGNPRSTTAPDAGAYEFN